MEPDDEINWGDFEDDEGGSLSPEFRIFPPELPVTKVDETTDSNFPFQKNFSTLPLPESCKQQSLPLTEILLRTYLPPDQISRHGKKGVTHLPEIENTQTRYSSIRNLITPDDVCGFVGALRILPTETGVVEYPETIPDLYNPILTIPYDATLDDPSRNLDDSLLLLAAQTKPMAVLGCDGKQAPQQPVGFCCETKHETPHTNRHDLFPYCRTNNFYATYICPFDLSRQTKAKENKEPATKVTIKKIIKQMNKRTNKLRQTKERKNNKEKEKEKEEEGEEEEEEEEEEDEEEEEQEEERRYKKG